jgi:hypothetical protein
MNPSDSPFQPSRPASSTLQACPLCQTPYTPLSARILAERDDAHLIYIQCRHCSASLVAFVTIGPNGLESVGTVTDLTSIEVLAAHDRSAVTTDDVLTMYTLLNRPSAFLERLRS